jgi:ABC-type nitrate/sulfonate/bicarbonate transport system permease component
MLRTRKSYAYDKMFAVIILCAVFTLALVGAVSLVEKIAMPYRKVSS